MTGTFNFNEINNFDEHIAQSIPNYNFMIEQVEMYARHYYQKDYPIYDVGCSTGSMVNRLANDGYDSYGIDSSSLVKVSDRLKKGDFFEENLPKCSVITSIFFLQFLSRQSRKNALEKIQYSLINNGIAIICEKTLFDDSEIENVTSIGYLYNKLKSFDGNDILKKSYSLLNTMWLKTNKTLYDELSAYGEATLFFKSYGFEGYILKKGKS